MMIAILILVIVNIIWTTLMAAVAISMAKERVEQMKKEMKEYADGRYKTLLKVILNVDQIIEQADEACR